MAESKVDAHHPAFDAMLRRWQPIDALISGTQGIRDLATGTTADDANQFLPREPKEDLDIYRRRVNRTFVYGMLTDTVKQYAARPFSRTVAIETDAEKPEWLEALEENADGAGNSLHHVLKTAFKDAWYFGLSHLMVDFPDELTGEETNADVERGVVHPNVVNVKAHELFSWRTRVINGRVTLTHARIAECKYEPTDAFGVGEVNYVRVFDAPGEPVPDAVALMAGGLGTEGYWSLYREETDHSFSLVDAGRYSADRIPIVTFYTDRVAPMVAKPPLDELAWVNIAHVQRFSDTMTAVRFASVAHAVIRGMTPDQAKKIIDGGMSWSRIIAVENPAGGLDIAEHSGQAIGAMFQCNRDLEKRAEVLGLRPMVESTGERTASEAKINSNSSMTQLQASIQDLEAVALEVLGICFKVMGEQAPDDLAVDIYSDFDAAIGSAEILNWLLQARGAREITQETMLREAKRIGGLSEQLDVSAEVEGTESEGPELLPNPANPAMNGASGGRFGSA